MMSFLTSRIEGVNQLERNLREHVGNSTKERHIRLKILLAAHAFRVLDYSIAFDPQSEENRTKGLKTIWQHIAWKVPVNPNGWIPLSNPTDWQRYESASRYAKLYENAFYAFKNKLRDYHKIALYMVPSRVGQQRIMFITINDDLVVNDNEETARFMEEQRLRRGFGIGGQSFSKRMLVVKGDKKEVAQMMREQVDRMADDLLTEFAELTLDSQG